MTPLDQKLLRDLRRLWVPVIAACAVLSCGIATFVMARGMSDSLERARDRYYVTAGMADFSASLTRAPVAVAASLSELPGIIALEARVGGIGLVTLEGVIEPVSLQLVSLPTDRRPRVNDIVLRSGRWPRRERRPEGIINEAFALEHRLSVDDRVTVIIHGRRQDVRIVGIASSPEFVFAVAPGDLLPEPRRFGVLWMERSTLAHALDLDGAFNELVWRVSRMAKQPALIAKVDTLLAPFGGRGVIGRDRMLSARYLSDELSQLDTLARILPPIFLAVAGFLIHVMLARLVTTERANIGLLKAFGYPNTTIGLHYLRFALLMSGLASVLGVVLGIFVGRFVAAIYQSVYHLPSLEFEARAGVLSQAVLVALIAAMAGAIGAVSKAVKLAPAIALAPPVPPSFRSLGVAIEKRLDRLGARLRMIIRRILRFPRRSASTVGGVALALALLIIAEHFPITVEKLLSLQFGSAQRMDVTLAFVNAVSRGVMHDVARLPGVMQVEPGRMAEVVFSVGARRERDILVGLMPGARLSRLVDLETQAIEPTAGGLTLSAGLARKLGVVPGDEVRIAATQGQRAVFTLPVLQVVQPFLGSAAYVDQESLGRWLREPDRANSAHLLIDAAYRNRLAAHLKSTPKIVGVTFIDQAEQSLRSLFAQGSGFISSLFRVFAVIMAAGIALSTARVTLGEQARDLATLRVLGFDRRETSWVLLGELMVLLFVAIPFGLILGGLLSHWLMSRFETELFSFPVVFDRRTYAQSALAIIAAVSAAALWVRREIDRLNLVTVLKSHE